MLLLYVAFDDRTKAGYVVTEEEATSDAAMELRVEGTRDPPAFWKYFPAFLGYDKPPPRHSWSTVLPDEAIFPSYLSLRL